MLHTLVHVDHRYAGAAIGLLGGLKAADLGMLLQESMDALAQFAGAVAVDDPQRPVGFGDRPF